MGEAKRRKLLDPNYGKPRIQVTIEKSELTGKWLVVADILGHPHVISPHYQKADAVAASQQVFEKFNTITLHEWRRYIAGDPQPFDRAILLLDYDDDDELIGVETGEWLDCRLASLQHYQEYINQQMIGATGKPLFRVKPGSWLTSQEQE